MYMGAQNATCCKKCVPYNFRCHRCVLASASKVFADLLSEDKDGGCSFVESGDHSLVLCDITNDELELLISFLYTGFAAFNTASESNRFHEILRHLGVPVTSQSQQEPPPVFIEDLGNLIVDDLFLPEDTNNTVTTHDSGHEVTTVDQSEILYEFELPNNTNTIDDCKVCNVDMSSTTSEVDSSASSGKENDDVNMTTELLAEMMSNFEGSLGTVTGNVDTFFLLLYTNENH